MNILRKFPKISNLLSLKILYFGWRLAAMRGLRIDLLNKRIYYELM
jgi:hypothetical protein